MKKRSIYLLVWVCVVSLWLRGTTSAVNLQVVFSNSNRSFDTKRISPIHFRDYENNFGGFFYISESNSNSDLNNHEEKQAVESVSAWDDKYECAFQMRWFYYNSQRWERLWPLDQETSKSWGFDSDLGITWGLYTECKTEKYYNLKSLCEECQESSESEKCDDYVDEEGNFKIDTCLSDLEELMESEYWIYGSIQHKYKSQDMYLIAWTEYQTWDVWISTKNGLGATFILFNNTYPFGLMYDSIAGVWFVWCEVWSGALKNLISSDDWKILSNFEWTGDNINWYPIYTWLGWENAFQCNPEKIWQRWIATNLLWIVVQWLIWWSTDNTVSEVKWNINDSKMQYFSTDSVSNAILINSVRSKAASLCGWKWISGNGWQSSIDNTSKVVCIDAQNLSFQQVNASDPSLKWKTLIVKNGNVVVTPNSKDDDKKYDIFVYNGNLLIKDGEWDQMVFNRKWFPMDDDITPDSFRQNLMNINQCSDGSNTCPGEENNDACAYLSNCSEYCCPLAYTWDAVSVWKLLRWNFIVNGKIQSTSDDSKIKNKYFVHGKLSSLDTDLSLTTSFAWRCIDWCENDEDAECNACLVDASSSFLAASLVVIDQNYYDSPLFW